MSTRFIQGTPVNYQGRTDGAVAPTGQIGEILSSTTTTAITVANVNLASLTLTPGIWTVSGSCTIGGDATARYLLASISTVSVTHDTTVGRRGPVDYNTSTGTAWCLTFPRTINVSVSTTVYLVGSTTSVSGVSSTNSYLEAVRIA